MVVWSISIGYMIYRDKLGKLAKEKDDLADECGKLKKINGDLDKKCKELGLDNDQLHLNLGDVKGKHDGVVN